MRYQEYCVKAGIASFHTVFLICHESQYFYLLTFSNWNCVIIFSFLASETHPYLFLSIELFDFAQDGIGIVIPTRIQLLRASALVRIKD